MARGPGVGAQAFVGGPWTVQASFKVQLIVSVHDIRPMVNLNVSLFDLTISSGSNYHSSSSHQYITMSLLAFVFQLSPTENENVELCISSCPVLLSSTYSS